MSFGAEIVELSAQFFNDEIEYDEAAKEVLAGETVPQVMAAFKAQLEGLESFDADLIKAAIKAVQKETGVKGKNLFMPIRVAITGEMHGPELPNAIRLIGKEKAIAKSIAAFLFSSLPTALLSKAFLYSTTSFLKSATDFCACKVSMSNILVLPSAIILFYFLIYL